MPMGVYHLLTGFKGHRETRFFKTSMYLELNHLHAFLRYTSFFKKHKFKKHETQNAEILRNI